MAKAFATYRRGQRLTPAPSGTASSAIDTTLGKLLDRTDGLIRPLVVSSMYNNPQCGSGPSVSDPNSGNPVSPVSPLTAVMTRTKFTLPYGGTWLRLAFGNSNVQRGSDNGTGYDGIGDPYTVTSSIETPAGEIYACAANGKRQGGVDYGLPFVTDPVPYCADAGGYVVGRDYRTFASGAVVYCNYPKTATQEKLGLELNGTDKTLSGTVGNSTSFLANLVLQPMAVIGEIPAGQPQVSVIVLGDSISPPILDALAGVVPLHAVNYSGQAFSNFVGPQSQARMAMAKYATHAMVQLGVNDFRGNESMTLASMQALARATWAKLKAAGASRIIPFTLAPYTDSTDGWITTTNQTVRATQAARAAYNAWIRSQPDDTLPCVDWAAVLGTGTDYRFWKANYTGDGTHPNGTQAAAATAAMSAVVTPSLFV